MLQYKELIEAVLCIKIESYFVMLSDNSIINLDKYTLNYRGEYISSITSIETETAFSTSSADVYITSLNINGISINIYELAHKIKEWAYDKCFIIAVWKVPMGYRCEVSSPCKSVKSFGLDTEPEAIFEAGNYVFKSLNTFRL